MTLHPIVIPSRVEESLTDWLQDGLRLPDQRGDPVYAGAVITLDLAHKEAPTDDSCDCRLPLRAYTDALGYAMNQGFFEFELRSGDRTFIATVEFLPPGLEASEARAKVPDVWELYFAAPEVVVPGSTTCMDSRPIKTKPDDALKVPKGIAPVLIWKSEEK